MAESPIHLRVPAETKARWVRASRQRGKRLSTYITEAVEARIRAEAAQAEQEDTNAAHNDPV